MSQTSRAWALVLAFAGVAFGIVLIGQSNGGGVCFGDGGQLLARWGILYLPLTLGYVWIASEGLRMASETLFRRTLATAQTLWAAVTLHFLVGAAGFAFYTDVPSGEGPGVRFLTWVPFWTFGLLFKAGGSRCASEAGT